MARITIQDVALYAGVSQSTVSRVLNGNVKVAPSLRDRVLQATQMLEYQPNRVARRLRASASDVLGVIISDIQNSYFPMVIRGIEDAAYANNMHIILCNSDEEPAKFESYLQIMLAECVAGLIVTPSSNTDAEKLAAAQILGIPVVVLDRELDHLQTDVIKVDNIAGAFQAVTHLIRGGYRRIAMIYPDMTTGYERYQGYVDAHLASDIEIQPQFARLSDVTAASGYQQACELLAIVNPPDAIFTANNQLTLGALRALRECGKRVPEDVALVGFDDVPWAEELRSPLTTIAQPTYQLGQEAVRLLLQRLSCPQIPPLTVTLPAQLIIRESCGARRAKSQKNPVLDAESAGIPQTLPGIL